MSDPGFKKAAGDNLDIPDEIIESVRNRECILFLGAMASAPSPDGCRYIYKECPPGGGELSRRLAEKFEYPGEDKANLQRVALFVEFGPNGSRKRLVDTIAREISRPRDDTPDGFQIQPSPALRMLASLPFPIIITTNYDRLFDTAIGDATASDGRRKMPLIRVYDPCRNGPPEEVPVDPKEEKPILLKLHGDIDKQDSIVITEEDYITFVQRMADPHLHPIHEYIRVRMRAWPFLFVGYSLKDYNLRLLFRTLRWGMEVAHYPLSFSVDPYPDNLIVAVWQRGDQPMVSFIQEDLWNFVPELYRKVIGKEYQV